MEEPKLTVRAVERALDILLCFIDDTELGLTEISQRVKLHKSTVHRLLASLESKGFISRVVSTDKYKLGFRMWELSMNLSHTDDIAIVLLPEMQRLRDRLGETISLYIRDREERIRIQAVESSYAIRRVAPIGVRLPLFVGASSKVLIAYADKLTQEQILDFVVWPEYIDKTAFRKQLAKICECGYATSVEEREIGAAAVAAPIFNSANKLVAALSVSGPANRFTVQKMKEQSGILIEAAKRMSKMVK